MNAFLVVAGVLIVGILIAMWIVKQLGVKTKLWGIPLVYLLDVALLLVITIAVIVVKVALGNKNKQLEALLVRLKIQKAQNDINIVDDHIKEKTDTIANINQQISVLAPATQQNDINNLIAQQEGVKKELADLNLLKQDHFNNQTNLQQQIKNLEAL